MSAALASGCGQLPRGQCGVPIFATLTELSLTPGRGQGLLAVK